VRKTAGREFRAGSIGAKQLVRISPGFGSNGSARLRDGFKRNHGKFRILPRHSGCGRLAYGASAAASGR